MILAGIVGGYLGASVARRMNKNLVRRIVVLIGFILAAHYFYKLFTDEPPQNPQVQAIDAIASCFDELPRHC